MTIGELLIKWLKSNIDPVNHRTLLSVVRAEPRFQTHNYFARYKIRTARLDPSGLNPIEIKCVVIEISETDQSVNAVSTPCDEIQDL
jgi:hypothetical protein